jgi:hypothetical protein
MGSRSSLTIAGVVLVVVSCALRAQGHPPDQNPAALPVTTIQPQAGGNFVVNGPLTWSYGNYEVQGNLIVDAGGNLYVCDSNVVVRGNVELRQGGILDVADSTFALQSWTSQQLEYHWYGGHLSTERTTIGGAKIGSTSYSASFRLDNGFWDARDTTVQHAGGILLGAGRIGYLGRADQRGGTLRANGLFAGEAPDALQMSGMGDAFLENSTFPIGIYVYADAPAPFTTTLDLGTRAPIVHDVYGDPTVHDGVTRPLPYSPYRLEIKNSRVPHWILFASQASSTEADVTIEMLNAEAVICALSGKDIAGTPTYGGDWSRYPKLPGLPSTYAPAAQPIPPGAWVKIGNVRFKAGPRTTDEVHIQGWNLHLLGAGTDLTIRGAVQNSETWIEDGRIHFLGDADFEAGVHGNRLNAHGMAQVLIDHGSVGLFAAGSFLPSFLRAHGQASITVRNSRIADLTVTTLPETANNSSRGLDFARITLDNCFLAGRLTTEPSAGGVITEVRARRDEAWDLQNLDFEGAVTQPLGCPDFWQCPNNFGVSSTDARPQSPGGRSFEFQTNGSVSTLHKTLRLSPGTKVQLLAWVKNLQSQQVECVVSGPASSAVAAVPASLDRWELVGVPIHTVAPNETTTTVGFRNVSPTARARVDDFRVVIANWWEHDNLVNLDFEEGFRSVGLAPDFSRAPDYWRVWQAQCEAAAPRPGSSGTRAVQVTATHEQNALFKDLTFLRQGDVLDIRVRVKGIPATPGATCWTKVQVGEGLRFWDTSLPWNRGDTRQGDGTTWHQMDIVYTVPGPPNKQPYTRFNLEVWGTPGNRMIVDDITITIRE